MIVHGFLLSCNNHPNQYAFIASGRADTIVTVRPNREAVQKLRRHYRQTTVPLLRLRLVKYEAGSTVFTLASTLIDQDIHGTTALPRSNTPSGGSRNSARSASC